MPSATIEDTCPALALAPELTFLAVAAVAVPVCFLAGYAATRVPGISKVL